MGLLFNNSPKRRTLKRTDKEILYLRAKRKCEACNKKICLTEMQVGHKMPYSKGGTTSLRNSICLCYRCNKLQGTQSWHAFMRKQGKKPISATSPRRSKKKSNNNKKISGYEWLFGK